MRQLQFYKFTTWGLLALNLFLITFFFLTKPDHPPQRDARARAVDIMKLDRQQHEAFLEYARQHIQKMEGLEQQQRDLLQRYFHTLADSSQLRDTANLMTAVSQLERQKIESTYHHLQEVESLLRPEQRVGFEKFIDSALEIILLEKKNPLPPKEN